MAKMTQVISQFPPAPDSQHDTATEFNAKADTFVHHQADTYVTEVNTWKDQANSLEVDMNTIKTEIDQVVATIPAGSIDDTKVTSLNAWSAVKLNDYFFPKTGGTLSGNITAPTISSDRIAPTGHSSFLTADIVTVSGGGAIEQGAGWVKFPDGTMICTFTRDLSSLSVSTGEGALFTQSSELTWTYPKTFIGVPSISAISVRAEGAHGITIFRARSSECDYKFWSSKSLISSTAKSVYFNAVGRWK